jgi:hypothetical protein
MHDARQRGASMSDPKQEKIHKLERQMADRMREHQDLMERFINTGDHSAQEKANGILHDWHRLRKERDELKERLNKPERYATPSSTKSSPAKDRSRASWPRNTLSGIRRTAIRPRSRGATLAVSEYPVHDEAIAKAGQTGITGTRCGSRQSFGA